MREREVPPHPLERRYSGLSAYLTACAARGETRVTLAFGAIEATILGQPLPASARAPRYYRTWWRANNAAFAHGWYGWQRAGCTVEAVDLAAETVTFSRGGGERGDA
jgi:hypothetical protein